jgi:hypothetical protein
MPTTRVSEIDFQGDPSEIRPRNRRERRAKAKLMRAKASAGPSRVGGRNLPHQEAKGYVGGKL